MARTIFTELALFIAPFFLFSGAAGTLAPSLDLEQPIAVARSANEATRARITESPGAAPQGRD